MACLIRQLRGFYWDQIRHSVNSTKSIRNVGVYYEKPKLIPNNKIVGYLLYHLGYDVWLGNARGNTYSQGHVKYKRNGWRDERQRYWNFSWHEIGKYDLPASIDYIVGITGFPKIHYIGELSMVFLLCPHFSLNIKSYCHFYTKYFENTSYISVLSLSYLPQQWQSIYSH